MEIQRQWCDQESCPDFGKIGTNNVRIYSHAERRFYCTTCNHTFCADKGTFFETLRTEKNILLDAVAMLVERNSLRAIGRIKQSKPNTILHWLDLAFFAYPLEKVYSRNYPAKFCWTGTFNSFWMIAFISIGSGQLLNL
jgi:transposase-like protein